MNADPRQTESGALASGHDTVPLSTEQIRSLATDSGVVAQDTTEDSTPLVRLLSVLQNDLALARMRLQRYERERHEWQEREVDLSVRLHQAQRQALVWQTRAMRAERAATPLEMAKRINEHQMPELTLASPDV